MIRAILDRYKEHNQEQRSALTMALVSALATRIAMQQCFGRGENVRDLITRPAAELAIALDVAVDALRMAEPVLLEAIAVGVFPPDDMSDRLALDAVQTAIGKAEAAS